MNRRALALGWLSAMDPLNATGVASQESVSPAGGIIFALWHVIGLLAVGTVVLPATNTTVASLCLVALLVPDVALWGWWRMRPRN
jgi:hypothetical protein